MTVLSDQSIRMMDIISPFHERTVHNGMSFGCGPCTYDVRIDQSFEMRPREFVLASTIEHFNMPFDVTGETLDKSTWARRGLSAFNTFIDAGWRGYLTLELVNLGNTTLIIRRGDPIVQIKFSWVDTITEGYIGKYQDQVNEPVEAIDETCS